jgi:hypothetical protein
MPVRTSREGLGVLPMASGAARLRGRPGRPRKTQGPVSAQAPQASAQPPVHNEQAIRGGTGPTLCPVATFLRVTRESMA